jgi:hypothetical protein
MAMQALIDKGADDHYQPSPDVPIPVVRPHSECPASMHRHNETFCIIILLMSRVTYASMGSQSVQRLVMCNGLLSRLNKRACIR